MSLYKVTFFVDSSIEYFLHVYTIVNSFKSYNMLYISFLTYWKVVHK